jgi:hypothetical protein
MARRLILTAAVLTLLGTAGAGNADVIHRWSFNGNTTDSVGGADAILMGHATVDSSQLQLDGVDGYAILPIGDDLLNLTNCTIEGWATWTRPPTSFWERIFDFGNDTVQNFFLTPFGGNRRFRVAITTNGGGDEEQTIAGFAFQVNTEAHFAVVIDADNGIHTLYYNGRPAAVTYGCTNTTFLFDTPLMNTFLGKSQYGADAFFMGSINEFRVYNNALSGDDVAASYAAGPDA